MELEKNQKELEEKKGFKGFDKLEKNQKELDEKLTNVETQIVDLPTLDNVTNLIDSVTNLIDSKIGDLSQIEIPPIPGKTQKITSVEELFNLRIGNKSTAYTIVDEIALLDEKIASIPREVNKRINNNFKELDNKDACVHVYADGSSAAVAAEAAAAPVNAHAHADAEVG